MCEVSHLGGALFIAASGVGVVSWFAAVAEFIMMHRLHPFVFRIGRMVVQESVHSTPPGKKFKIGQVYKLTKGKFKFISDRELLFCEKLKPLVFRWHTPFPIKGRLSWNPPQYSFEGRIPLGFTVFFLAWLAGCTMGGIMLATCEASVSHVLKILGFVVIGWIVVVGMYFSSLSLEIRRARAIVKEIESELNASKND